MYSEKHLIKKIAKQSAEQRHNTANTLKMLQTTYAFSYNLYILSTLAINSVTCYLVVYLHQSKHLFQTGIWSLIGLLLTGILYFFSQLIYQKDQETVPTASMHRFMLFSSFVSGIYVTSGTFIVLHNHGLPQDVLTYAHTGYILVFIIVSLVSLGVLSSRLEYILTYFVTSNLASFYFIFQHVDSLFQRPYFSLYYMAFTAFMFVMIIEEYRNRKRVYKTYLEHNDMLQEIEAQKEFTELNMLQLESEMHQRQEAEKELLSQNQRLEAKVKERTDYVSQVNANLIRSKNSLEMAYLAAGLASWDWDIENKTLTGKNFDIVLGYSPKRIQEISQNLYEIIHPDDRDVFKSAMLDVISKEQKKLDLTIRTKNIHDEWLWIDVKGISISENPQTKRVIRMVGVCRDVTIERNIVDSLALSNSVFEQSSEAIFVLDDEFKYISVNPSFEKVTGFSHEEVKGLEMFANQHNKEAQLDYGYILDKLRADGEFSGEITELNKAGERLFLHVSVNTVYNDDGKIVNYIGIFSDVTRQTQDRQKLSYLSNYDPLTDLPNRTFFKQQLHTLLIEKTDKFAVIRINIDRFRILNNSLGSKNADTLLQLVSERLSRLDYSFRALARISGDDFAVLISHLSLHSLKGYVDSVLDSFKQPFYVDDHEVAVSLSVGISLYPQHGHQVDTLMNRSEQALKRAKLNGGNDYFIYNQGLQVSSLDNLQLENELRRAIAHGELVVFYQPKVDLTTGRLIGFEALVRWHHEKRGLLLPKDFIAMAEETGLISDLTIEVLSQTCQQIKRWEDYGYKDISVAVNIEARQLKRGNFLSTLDNIMEASGIKGESLEIEITESSLMDMPEKIKPLLASIKSRNIKISLDDFGTGYSSLSYLSQYPIDVLKIDRSFISDISTNKQSAAIAQAIMAMGHSLGITLIAEGIENAQQRDFLHAEGCQVGQGYYYGKPVPVTEATKLLQRQHNSTPTFVTLAAKPELRVDTSEDKAH